MFKNLLTKAAIGLSICAFFLLSGAVAQAQTPGYYTATTSSYNNYPFNGGTSGGSMCQFLYLPSNFSSTPPTGGMLITTIYFYTGNAGSYNYSNMLIKLGNTTMTALSSGTWNTGLTTVYSQSSVSWSWTSGTWYAITLSTPFFYNGGNLIVEASQAGTSNFTGGMGVNYFASTTTARMYGITGNTSSQGADTYPLSFGFDLIPAACSGTPSAPTVVTPPFPPTAPLCAGSTTTLTASNPNLGNGLSVQWQISSGGSSGPWANVTNGSGATTLSYTTGAVLAPTYYRMGVTCSNSNLTTYSAPYYLLTGAPIPS
ncbi:MAG: hypothetical protein ABI378_02835, partial [Chitinophagaceae bacterium]